MEKLELNLSAPEIEKIVGFLGYGRPDAPVWFIGLEEGLGNMSSAEAVNNLKVRASFEAVMDLRRAHNSRLWEKGSLIDWDKNPPNTQVWQYMGKIMRACNQHMDCCSNLKAAKDYVKLRLGRSDSNVGQTFLTELSPIPAANGKDKRWTHFFKQSYPGLEGQIEKRKKELKTLIKANPHPLIICYGSRNEGSRNKDFGDLLDVEWDSIRPRVFQARGHRHLLLPFFCCGQIGHPLILDLLKSGLLNLGEFR
jgi:hypothetical protein